ncbi:MAG: hypothetical protein H6712_11860 [Myxococcales bacterium]|nr:hypothetical protein [Myxococcales bacterium]MCB9714550.1 hypothetical protein [Myxococcales bacterium]
MNAPTQETKHGYPVHSILVYTVYPERAADVFRFGRFLSMVRADGPIHKVRCHFIGEAVMPFIKDDAYPDLTEELRQEWKETIDLGLTSSLCELSVFRRMDEEHLGELLQRWDPMDIVDPHDGQMKLLSCDKRFMF